METNNLSNTYKEFLLLTDRLLGEDVRAVEIAPILIKLGLEIYKTILTPDEYERMVEYIYEHRNDVNDLSDFIPEIH